MLRTNITILYMAYVPAKCYLIIIYDNSTLECVILIYIKPLYGFRTKTYKEK